MKTVAASLIWIAIAAASTQGRIQKQHARGFKGHPAVAKRTNTVEPGVAYEALVGYGYQSGQEGACGQTYTDDDLVAGLSTLTYSQDVCGQCIQVSSSDGNTLVAPIEDSCTPADEGELCHGYYDLYLSVAAFKQLAGGNLDAGLVNATWQLTDCQEGEASAAVSAQTKTQAFSAAEQSAVESAAASNQANADTQQAYTAPAQTAAATSSAAPQQARAQVAQVDTQAGNDWVSSAAAAVIPTTSEESSAAPAATASAASTASGDKSGWPSTKFGVAWGVDNNLADALAGGVISSYMHWKDGPVDGLGDAMYMPMLEKSDDSSGSQFNSVIAGLSSPPKVVLGQNEIDTDATYTEPSVAADYFRRYVTPHCADAALCCSPSITYEIDHLKQFLDACPDCGINCLQLHVYRSAADNMASDAQDWLTKAYNTLGNLPVVVSETGVDTRNGDASDSQVVSFMSQMASWAYTQDWIVTLQWSGGFQSGNPWDSFLANANALLSGNGLSWPGQCWRDNKFD